MTHELQPTKSWPQYEYKRDVAAVCYLSPAPYMAHNSFSYQIG